jgi:hypothetical protein
MHPHRVLRSLGCESAKHDHRNLARPCERTSQRRFERQFAHVVTFDGGKRRGTLTWLNTPADPCVEVIKQSASSSWKVSRGGGSGAVQRSPSRGCGRAGPRRSPLPPAPLRARRPQPDRVREHGSGGASKRCRRTTPTCQRKRGNPSSRAPNRYRRPGRTNLIRVSGVGAGEVPPHFRRLPRTANLGQSHRPTCAGSARDLSRQPCCGLWSPRVVALGT